MAISILSALAVEKSTYIVTASFTDDDGVAVVPGSVTWTLSTPTGTIINSRENVSATPAASIDIVLSGSDLAIGTNGVDRVLTVNAVYDSDAGSNLPLKAECQFTIENLVNVS